jgi:hypothetical protein
MKMAAQDTDDYHIKGLINFIQSKCCIESLRLPLKSFQKSGEVPLGQNTGELTGWLLCIPKWI